MSGLSDAVFRNTTPLITASRAAGLPKEEQERVDGLAFLVSKNKQLKAMPVDQARAQYERLTPDIQESLKQLFGDEDYNAEKPGALGGAWKYIRNAGESILDALSGYSQKITQPYRAFRIAQQGPETFFSKKTWQMAADGERLFDPEREAEVDAFYDPTVRKIAKRISMGDDFETVLSDMSTDAEFEAFRRFMDGDEEFKQAIADYNAAKISFGRDVANLFFDVNPGEFGAERKAFNVFSGAVDLVGQVAADPLTYIAAPFKAVQAARFGTMKLIQLRADGAVAFSARMDDIFARPEVREFWDTAGDMMQRSLSDDRAVRRNAMQELTAYAPDFDRDMLLELRKGLQETGFNADGAKEFLKQGGALEKIMRGKVGQEYRLLPRHTVTRRVKTALSSATDRFTGFKPVDADEAEKLDEFMTMIEQNALADMDPERASALIRDIAGKRGIRDRLVRTFERAPIEQFLYIGGDDAMGRSLRAKSSQTVYSLARTVMPRWHARALADAYSVTDHAGALNIAYGLMRTIGDASGATATAEGRAQFESVMGRMFRQLYSEDIPLDDVGRRLTGLGEEAQTYNPANSPAGIQRGLAEYHMADKIEIPPYDDILRILNSTKWNMVRGVSNTLNNRVTESMTNHWSAFTLLPRLGIRSAIDENLFHLTTMPLTYVTYLWRGRKASTAMRKLESDKQLGWLTRALHKVINPATEEMRAAVAQSPTKRAAAVEEQLAKRMLRSTDEDTTRWVGDLVRDGRTQYLRELDGTMTNIAYADPIDKATVQAGQDFRSVLKAAQQQAGIELKGMPDIIRKKDMSYNLNFLAQLFSRTNNNNEVGKIAVRFMDDPDRAVDEIFAWLQANPEYASKFELANSKGLRQFAVDQYLYTRNLYMTNTGELNTALLDKVRRVTDDGEVVVDANIGLDDIDEMADILPEEIFGFRGQKWDPRDSRESLLEEYIYGPGFAIADRQVAVISREPVYMAYYLGFRKQFKNVEAKYVENLMAANEGMTEKAARAIASKKYTALSSELAYNRMLGFIDNPMHRSNMAFSARNVARYYRATEDFYRRVARTAINNPEGIVRLRLASEGLDHAGFIQEDQNGERYFVMPVDQIMYRVYAPVVKALTGEWPKQPVPLRMTGKISMLTPSLDPESAIPALSGPLAAIGISTISRMLPLEYREDFVRTTLGPYAENRKLYDLLMPVSLKRGVEIAKAMDADGVSAQVMSATMKAAAFYTANGMGVGADASIEEREEFSRQVQATARNIVAIRNLIGIFSPVAPQLMTNVDVPKHLREAGVVSFKDSFNKLVTAELEKGNPNAYDDALMKWTRLRPGVLVYSVSETEMNTVATVRKTREAAEWIKDNSDLLERHPQGAAFLVPAAGEFDIEAYSFMKREGFIESKPLEDYFREIAVIDAENEYYDKRREHEERLKSLFAPYARTVERRKWDEWATQFRQDRPYLQLELEGTPGLQRKRDALADLSNLLEGPMAPQTAVADKMREMVRLFYQADSVIQTIQGQTDREVQYRQYLRQKADEQLRQLAGTNPNTSVLYNTVLKRLLGV